MNPKIDPHPSPERMRQGAELAFCFPGDFNNQALTKYENVAEKSIHLDSEPATTDLICQLPGPKIATFNDVKSTCIVDVILSPHERFGVFRVEQVGRPHYWTVARFPYSWKHAYRSIQVAPSPEGSIEQPRSVLPVFGDESAAVRTLERMIRPQASGS